MAQYDVYRNPTERTRRAIPYLIAVQHDAISETASVVVVPLVTPLKAVQSSRLYPLFSIGGKEHMLLTPDIASLPRSVLSEPVASLANERAQIVAALDILLVGS
jgi:toxin CcdB